MRGAGLALLVLLGAAGAGPAPPPVPLRDLKPRYVKGELLRSRTPQSPGLPVAGKVRRGLGGAVPFRAGFEIDGHFTRLTVEVGVLDGAREPVVFRVYGDGKPLVSTPPLFAGAAPLALDVPVGGVILMEIAAEGAGRARGAFLDGRLFGAAGESLLKYRATADSFSPEAYLPSFKRRINQAIEEALRHLQGRQGEDGSWRSEYDATGTTALTTLALLKAGVPGDDPRIARAFAWLRERPYEGVYAVSCLLMALEARRFPGGATPAEAAKGIPDDERAWIREAAAWLAAQQGMGFRKDERAFHPVWRYPYGGYDLSNTQYALFGLSAARRCGYSHHDVWLPALRYILGAQDRAGPAVEVSRYVRDGRYLRRDRERAQARGFGYQLGSRATGSMTSAGLCSLVLCEAALHRNAVFQNTWRRKTHEGIRDALAWLEEYYEIDENPFRGRTWWVYYLFNLERAGVLLDQRYLGTRDWYEEGSEVLMREQAGNGSVAGGPINTAFALLFWKRGTVPPLTQGK